MLTNMTTYCEVLPLIVIVYTCIGETAAAGGVLMGLGLRGVLEIVAAAATATATAAAGLAGTGPIYRETDRQMDSLCDL